MRKFLKKISEKCRAKYAKMTLGQRIGILVAEVGLSMFLVILCIVNAIETFTWLQDQNKAKMYTYSYDIEGGHGITGTVGQSLDDIYYVKDETVVFGPYSEKPTLQIPIVGPDIVIDTSNMSFAQDMSGGIGHGVSDCRKELRTRIDENTLLEAGLARYEDGEIYVYVQFLQKIENLGGSSYAAQELMAMSKRDSLTNEELVLAEKVEEIEWQGGQDLHLYSSSALDDIATDYTAAIEYRTDHLDLVGYCPERPILYDHK